MIGNENLQPSEIINCAIEHVNEFPELKSQGLKVYPKDCHVETVRRPQVTEIGASHSMMPPYWRVHIISNIFPGSHKHYIATVEQEVGGSLAVTRLDPVI